MMWLKVKKAWIEKVQKHIDGSSQNVPIWIWMQGPLTQKCRCDSIEIKLSNLQLHENT